MLFFLPIIMFEYQFFLQVKTISTLVSAFFLNIQTYPRSIPKTMIFIILKYETGQKSTARDSRWNNYSVKMETF